MKPMLQFAGVQEAVIAAVPPLPVPVTPKLVEFVVLQFPLPPTPTAASLELHQVSGTPVIVTPCESTIFGTSVPDPLELKVPDTERLMDSTGQVSTSIGKLLVAEIPANSLVVPGTLPVTWTWPDCNPSALVFSVITWTFSGVQLKGPTVLVMSVVPLNAFA